MKTCLALFLGLAVSYVTSTVPDFAASNNLFTASVYKKAINSGEENILISPLSAEIALALAQSGAKGATAEEIRTALHLPDTDEETRTSVKKVLQHLKNKTDFSLYTANKIYVNKGFPIKDNYKLIATDTYQAEIENLDFSHSVASANQINQWVEEQTNHKIKDLVEPSILSNSPAIIVNTLYFNASWYDIGFHKHDIGKRKFYKSDTESNDVDMMHHDSDIFNYYEDNEIGASILELPFKGETAHLGLILPKEKNGLAALEKKATKIFKTRRFRKELVEVTIPMFKIESKIDFKEILEELGVRKAFQSSQADFSGIAGNKGDLAIGGVLQKTFINVNKDGVEAAAATDLWFYMSASPPPEKRFIADHPFIFYIKVGDTILFAGRVISPKT